MKSIQFYNPREDSPEIIEKLLVGRTEILDEILSDLKRQIASSSRQHWLIRGPRGIGKTHLMARVNHVLRSDADLSAAWQPVWLSEKAAYEVYSAGWLLEKIARQLQAAIREHATAAQELSIADSVGKQIDDLEIEGDDPHYFDAALEILKEASRELGKKLLVIVENLDSLLAGFSARARSAESQRMRSLLLHDREFLFIGTTPTHHISGITDPKKPLYALFRERQLTGMTEEQTAALFANLADVYGQPERKKIFEGTREARRRLRVFHQLTGGIPRSIVMAYHVVIGGEHLEGMVTDLRSLLDGQTGYFEGRLAGLPPRERVIFGALCATEENLTAQEIAQRTRLPERSISTQLGRLVEEGHIVESSEAGGKGTLYEVSDALLRVWYQYREGRKLLEPVVHLLACWSSPEELANTIAELTAEMTQAESLAAAENTRLTLRHVEEAHLYQASESGKAERARLLSGIDGANVGHQVFEDLERALDLYRQQRHPEAIVGFRDFLARMDAKGAADRLEVDEAIARALLTLAYALHESGKVNEEAMPLRMLIARFGEREELKLQEPVANAMFNLGVSLGSAGLMEERIAAYRGLIGRYEERDELALQELVANAMFNLGVSLGSVGQRDGAIATYRGVIDRYGERDELALQETVASAKVNLGIGLAAAGQQDEAIGTFRDLIGRYREREQLALQEHVARAMVGLGVSLGAAGQVDEEIATYRGLIDRYGAREELTLQEHVARTMVNLGNVLSSAGQQEEAIATYRGVIDRYGEGEELALQKQVARAMVNLGARLHFAQRIREAIEVDRAVMERYLQRPDAFFREAIVRAGVNLGSALMDADRESEAEEVLRSIVDRVSEESDGSVRKEASRGYQPLVSLLIRRDESRAISTADEWVSAIVRDAETMSVEEVATAFRTLLSLFEEPQLRGWFQDLEALKGSPAVSETARYFRFVLDVLVASHPNVRGKKREGIAARRNRALRRIPVEVRETVDALATEILRERQAKFETKPRGKRKETPPKRKQSK